MEAWEFGLMAVAAYVAIQALIRIMLARRDFVYQRLLKQAEAEQLRQKQEAEKADSQSTEKQAA